MDTLKEFGALRDAGLTPEQSRAIVYLVQRTAEAPATPTQKDLAHDVRWLRYGFFALALLLIIVIIAV